MDTLKGVWNYGSHKKEWWSSITCYRCDPDGRNNGDPRSSHRCVRVWHVREYPEDEDCFGWIEQNISNECQCNLQRRQQDQIEPVVDLVNAIFNGGQDASSAYSINFTGTNVTTVMMGSGTTAITVGTMQAITVSSSPVEIIAVGKFSDGSSQIILDSTI